MKDLLYKAFIAAASLSSVSAVQAHPGHEHEPGLIQGLLHSISGNEALFGVLGAGLLLYVAHRLTR